MFVKDLPTAAETQLPRLRRRPTPLALHGVLRELAPRCDVWRPFVSFDQEERHAARVATATEYEVWLLTWLPGQSTGLHDHGEASGAFAVLSGEVGESSLTSSRGVGSPALVRRRLAEGRIRSFGPDHVHDVAHAGHAPAVTLHAYAPVLTTMRRFTLGEDRKARVIANERRGVDW